MSEEMKKTELTEEELQDIDGGRKKKDDKKSLGHKLDRSCLQCQITGRDMHQAVYRKGNIVYCPKCKTEYPEWR